MGQFKHPNNIKSVMDDPQAKRIFFWIIAILIVGLGMLAFV